MAMRAAVLGSPIAHSLSPVLHTAAYRALGLTGWSYQAIDCTEPGLPELLRGCGRDWAGLSLTMPLKRAVLPLLDQVDPLAADVGGANTVTFAGGARRGHNTDVPGMIAALAEAGVGPARRLARRPSRRSSSAAAPPPARRWPACAGSARTGRRWPSATRPGPRTCSRPRTGWGWGSG